MPPQYNPNDLVILRAARILSYAPKTGNGYRYWIQFHNGERMQIDEKNIYRKKEVKNEQEESHS